MGSLYATSQMVQKNEKKIHIYKENIYVSQLQFIPIAKFGFLLKVKKKSAPEVMLRLF